ncbi:hypothetical protein Dimus_022829 [Dionaea muscipula]
MLENGLEALFSLIKRQKWENLFQRRELLYVAACKEFYRNVTTSISKKKEVARSSVIRVKIELNGMIKMEFWRFRENNGICEYIKDVWEKSTSAMTLEITWRFANDELISNARRVKSSEMKPFQHLFHFIVMKNVVPRFEKRDTTSFMDLTYIDHLLLRRKINLPRVMLRHMAYVISVPHHELPYGNLQTKVFEAYNEPTRRRDEDENAQATNIRDEEVKRKNNPEENFEWEVVHEEVELEVNKLNRKLRRGEPEKEVVFGESRSGEKFYDALDEERPAHMDILAPAAPVFPDPATPAQACVQPEGKTNASGVNPSGSLGHLSNFDFIHLQAEFARAL